jgi:uncharacterized protein YjbI with pentapeptide repeats
MNVVGAQSVLSDAAVNPRGRLLGGAGETLPVEPLVRRAFADAGEPGTGAVEILGGRGAGKTTALRHLCRRLCDWSDAVFLDDPELSIVEIESRRTRVVFTAREHRHHSERIATIELAPWDDDDAIEYLLARHRQRCASVMSRWRNDPNRSELNGIAQVVGVVLDEMAVNPSVTNASEALCRRVDRLLDSDRALDTAGARALEAVQRVRDADDVSDVANELLATPVLHLLRHRPVQLLLAAERIVWHLSRATDCADLTYSLPRDLVRMAGERAARRPAAIARLTKLAGGSDWLAHATSASILLVAQPNWRGIGLAPRLTGAFLNAASWANVNLRGAQLASADFTRADLSDACLDECRASSAIFHRAKLRGASMTRLVAAHADFTGADLAACRGDRADFSLACFDGASLAGARFRKSSFDDVSFAGANLSGADLSLSCFDHATLDGADLRQADLSKCSLRGCRPGAARLDGANFNRAILTESHFEHARARGICFAGADLTKALLTGAVMPGANLRGATLRNAGLADVDWQGADLRDADFSGASFHLGSTRSGLVGSAIAGEGSRTGFYTDEFVEQSYKPPEEIRKANLCNTDLRGAKVSDCDWYLVDLRGAKYYNRQAEHFARCGAILREATE